MKPIPRVPPQVQRRSPNWYSQALKKQLFGSKPAPPESKVPPMPTVKVTSRKTTVPQVSSVPIRSTVSPEIVSREIERKKFEKELMESYKKSKKEEEQWRKLTGYTMGRTTAPVTLGGKIDYSKLHRRDFGFLSGYKLTPSEKRALRIEAEKKEIQASSAPFVVKAAKQVPLGVASAITGFTSIPSMVREKGAVEAGKEIAVGMVRYPLEVPGRIASHPSEVGAVAGELLVGAATGKVTGMAGSKVPSLRFVGKEEIPAPKIVPEDVLAGKRRFPMYEGTPEGLIKGYEVGKGRIEESVARKLSKKRYLGFHMTPEASGARGLGSKVFEVSSKVTPKMERHKAVPGMHMASRTSVYFARVGGEGKGYRRFGLPGESLARALIGKKPGGLAIGFEEAGRLPSKYARTYELAKQFFLEKAEKGKAYTTWKAERGLKAGSKIEEEIALAPTSRVKPIERGGLRRLVGRNFEYYMRYKGKKLPIHRVEAIAEKRKGTAERLAEKPSRLSREAKKAVEEEYPTLEEYLSKFSKEERYPTTEIVPPISLSSSRVPSYKPLESSVSVKSATSRLTGSYKPSPEYTYSRYGFVSSSRTPPSLVSKVPSSKTISSRISSLSSKVSLPERYPRYTPSSKKISLVKSPPKTTTLKYPPKTPPSIKPPLLITPPPKGKTEKKKKKPIGKKKSPVEKFFGFKEISPTAPGAVMLGLQKKQWKKIKL